MSIMEVQGRITEIQSQLALLGTARLPSTAASGAAFAATLATQQAAGTSGASGSVSGDAVVAEAKKYLGLPYVWGGTDPKSENT